MRDYNSPGRELVFDQLVVGIEGVVQRIGFELSLNLAVAIHVGRA